MECSFKQRVLREWNQSAFWDWDCAAWWKASHRKDSQIFLGTFLECGIGFLWGGLYPHGLSKSVYRSQSLVKCVIKCRYFTIEASKYTWRSAEYSEIVNGFLQHLNSQQPTNRFTMEIENIARNQGHFEPANNYQRYIVLHSGTIEYQENSIWQRSRLDLQWSVFRTMTYTI